MQIACEKCSTLYNLDERLIPPGGAPVQCTRCGHVFVAIAGATQPSRSSTAIFGHAPQVKAEEDDEDASDRSGQTQIFGKAPQLGAAPVPASNPRSTQVFGAVGAPPAPAAPAPAAAPPHTTQVFGAVKPADRPVTQMFGAVKPGELPEAPRSSTAMFGAVKPGEVPEAPRSSTAMFGAVKPAEVPEAPRSSTAMFGAVAPASLPRITFGGAAQPSAGSSEAPTVTEGVAPFALTDPADIDPAMASTQKLTGAELARALAAERARQAATGPGPGMTAELQLAPTPGMTAELQLAPTRGMTAELKLSPTPGMTAELRMAPTAGMTSELQVTSASPARAYAPVQLPPEAPLLEKLETPGYGVPAHASPNRIPTFAILGIVAVLVGGYFLFLHNRTPKIAPELAAAREGAVLLLRRDDTGSRQRAVTELEGLVAAHPTYVDARADLVAALALQLDDARLQHERMLGEVRLLENEIERLTNAQSPSDWQNRVYVLGDQVAALRKDAPIRAREAEGLESRLTEEQERYTQALSELKRVNPTSARVHARSRALYASVAASADAPAAIDALRGGETDGWAQVAQAQHALNARVSEGELTQARGGIEGVLASDSSFIRAYVLVARIAMRQERYEAAITALEAAAALNPDHQTARDLLTWAQASQRAVEAAGR